MNGNVGDESVVAPGARSTATRLRWGVFRRIVLNDVPGPGTGDAAATDRGIGERLSGGGDGGGDGAAGGEALARAVLAGLAAHTGDDGRVAYRRLAVSSELAAVAERARALRAIVPERLGSRETRLAFWINVYNALAIHGVVALGVRRSVREVWNFFGRVSYRVGPHVVSLDEIEHGILRGNARRLWPPRPPFGPCDARRAFALVPLDPRIHFALNCGARSCPPVGVYRAAAVDAQLDLAARNFLNQEVSLDAGGRVTCSRILKWYGRDFGSRAALAEFLLRYLDDGEIRHALAAGRLPCQAFQPYSWALPHPAADP